MVINFKGREKLYDKVLFLHVLWNDYIVYSSKMLDMQKSLKKYLDSLSNKKAYDDKTLFIPTSTYVGDLCSYQGFKISVIGRYIDLNDRLALLSLNFSELSDRDLRTVWENILTYAPISRLFDHMKGFIKDQKIDQYKSGYEEFNREINDISNSMLDYIRNKYPDAQADEELLQYINQFLSSHLSEVKEEIHAKFIDNCYSLLKSPIIIRLRDLEIKMDGLLGIKPYYEEEIYSKRTKKFIINAVISSFIKVLPVDLWQLSNEDALSILVKPKVEYEVVHDKDYDRAINRIEKNNFYKTMSILIKPDYYLISLIDYTLSNSIKPIRISLNISGLSFILKSKSIKNFVIVLNEVINNVYEKVIKELLKGYLICSRLAI